MKRMLLLMASACLVALVLAVPALAEGKASPAKENPAATDLLAEAIANRATWHNFPGFTADLEINNDGKVAKGKVVVNEKGKIELELGKDVDSKLAQTVREALGSIVSHRMPSRSTAKTACAFGGDDSDNAQGRLLLVVEDKFHSSYRVRDRQIQSVTRQMGDTRFTITMLENRWNDEKHYLPVSYVVNYWDAKTGALTKTTAFHQTWQHVGAYDLPLTSDEVTASNGKLDSFALKLSNHKLSQ